ncbi:MAG: phosphotransferase [Pseudodesulfovibrio sp.]|nr:MULTISPECIES: phosphotransferase [Pseudodesulfovibrio]MBU4191385.1 phosphotransferase [Pseudomonadota bacterium]MBU4244051.1 phosphotransferase [Pseudomonadota bacterium]MBU4380047.1 phosphotransferase [Pseudomonadota bacterium]MBU4474018.1 phosphotransferase [Pseudomonadota bacterium]MBU4515216.1 phosphotransferase [Pseudomonadota bacterium]
MKSLEAVAEFLTTRGWVLVDDPEEQIVSLGSRWNNDNYVITAHELYGETRYFLRLGRCGGLGRMARFDYEFGVLQSVGRSGVTPRPFYCDAAAVVGGEPVGALLMEYLPGRDFEGAGDWELVAQALAVVHAQPLDSRLLVRNDPVMDTYRLCAGPDAQDTTCGATGAGRAGMDRHGEEWRAELRSLVHEAGALLRDEARVVVHGSVQLTDFVVDEDWGRAWLVDWESGGVSSRYADLGLFIARAAAVGEAGFCRTEGEQQAFLAAYAQAAGLTVSTDVMLARASLFARVCRLQGLVAGRTEHVAGKGAASD